MRETIPLHEVSMVETPEQLELQLPLAGLGSRSLAYLVDLLWQSVPLFAGFVALVILLPDARPDRWLEKDALGQPRLPLAALAFMSALLFAINFGYFAFFEVLWKGQTPGKRSLGLRVVRDGGFPIDGRSALVRNLLRSVDFLPGFYVLGLTALFAGRAGKRIGDYAAGTFVIVERKEELQAEVAARKAGALAPAERALVVDFLVRRKDLTKDARFYVGRQLATRLAARLGRPAPADPERFLEELL